MRAVAASRKIATKRDHTSSSDKSGGNASSGHGGARQKIANQRSTQLKSKQSGYASSSLYTAVPTASQEPGGTSPEGAGDNAPNSGSIVPSKSRGSMITGGQNKSEKNSPSAQRRAETPMSGRSLEFADPTQSPGMANTNGPKKNIRDLMPRNTSNLSHAASSVATTNPGAATVIESRFGARRRARVKRFYLKAIALMVSGGAILVLGVVFAALYFAGWESLLMAGPIALSVGLLLTVCGIVWTSIIKAKLKRQQQIMSRTFSL